MLIAMLLAFTLLPVSGFLLPYATRLRVVKEHGQWRSPKRCTEHTSLPINALEPMISRGPGESRARMQLRSKKFNIVNVAIPPTKLNARCIDESDAEGGYRLPVTKLQVEITPDMVKKTAELAQIQVTDEEVSRLVPRMEEFIGFVEKMEELVSVVSHDNEKDKGASRLTLSSSGGNFLREDAVNSFANVEAMMDNMPVEEDNYLRVPRVGEDEA